MGKVKKTASSKHDASISPGIADFISKLCNLPLAELPGHLSAIDPRWPYPRGDLYHWIGPLNRFDDILNDFNARYGLNVGPQNQAFSCVQLLSGSERVGEEQLRQLGFGPEGDRELVQSILEFTKLLLEKCGNRTLYNSSERLNDLLNTTSLSLLHTTLRVALCLAQRHREKSRGFAAPIPSPYYSLDVDKLQKLSGPPSSVQPQTLKNLPSSPVKSVKGKEKSSQSARMRRISNTANPNDLRSMSGTISQANGSGKVSATPKMTQKDWSHLADIKITYSTSANGKEPAPSVEDPVATDPATPTPIRRQSGGTGSRLSRLSTTADQGYFMPISELQEDFASDHATLEIGHVELETLSIDQSLAKYRGSLPPDIQYELLHKLRNAHGLLFSEESRRELLVIRLLAIANLVCVLPEDKFAQKIFGPDQDSAKRQRFIQQLTSLLQESSKDSSRIPLHVQTTSMEVLSALAKQKLTAAEVSAALGVNSSHGVLLLLTQKAVNDLEHDRHGVDDTEVEEWQELIFSLLRTALEATAHFSTTGGASVSSVLLATYVNGLKVNKQQALRVQLKILEFCKSFYRHVKDGLSALSTNKAFDAVSDLLKHLVEDSIKLTSEGHSFPTIFRTPSTDFEIPYLHQQVIRSIIDLVNDIGFHQGPHADRVLRELIDSPNLLQALRAVVEAPRPFGAHTWSEVVRSVCGFLHNEPTSYTMISEAGLSRSMLQAVTLEPIGPTDHANLESSQSEPPNSDTHNMISDEGNNNDVLTAPLIPNTTANIKIISAEPSRRPQGILPSADAIQNIAQAFDAICLTNAGYDLLQSSGALQRFFEIFESPAHVKILKDGVVLGLLGSTFDELVRHQPTLRNTVLSSVIVMLARVRHIAHLLAAGHGAGPKLWRTHEADSTSVCGADSDPMFDLLSDLPPTADRQALTEKDLPLPDGSVLHFGSFPDPSSDSVKELIREINTNELDIYDYVMPTAAFLMNFFENQSLCNSFMESGGTDIVLDLIAMPYSQSLDRNGISRVLPNELPNVVHMMAETKPHLVLPVLVQRALVACRHLEPFSNNQPKGPDSCFKSLLVETESDHATKANSEMSDRLAINADKTVRALTALASLTQNLADIFDSQLYQRNSGTPFMVVNLADLYADLCQALAKISSSCFREDDAIKRQIPGTWLQTMEKQAVDEATRYAVGSDAVHDANQPTAEHEAPQTPAASPPLNSSRSGDQAQLQDEQSVSAKVKSSPLYRNAETLRNVLGEVPMCITRLFSMLSRGLDKKKMDSYQKQNASIVTNALASALVSQLKPYFFDDSSAFPNAQSFDECQFTYLVKVLANLKQIFFESSNAGGHGLSCVTWLVLAFKNAQGLSVLTEKGRKFFEKLKSCETSEQVLPLMTSANAGLKTCLEILNSLTRAKAIIESAQSNNFKSADPAKPFHFLPSQLLLELRMLSLPLVRSIWDSEYATQASNSVVESLVSILGQVLTGDHENDAYKNAQSLPEVRPYDTKKFSIDSAKEENLTAKSIDIDLAQEALYRCNNALVQAEEYCRALMRNSRRLRSPVPLYDLELHSPGANDATVQSLRGSEAPAAAAENVPAELMNSSTSDAAHASAAQDEYMDEDEDEEDDEDIELEREQANSNGIENQASSSPMSISRLLNRDETSSSEVPIRQDSAQQGDTSKKLTESSATASVSYSGIIFTVESIQTERDMIRQDLAERCFNLLSSHSGIIFDLADLIMSGAIKLTEENASAYRSDVSELLIKCLLSLQEDQITLATGKKIASTAHLLGLLLQDDSFYKKSLELLKEHFDSMLKFVRTYPNQSPASQDNFPWIGPILLIIEKMLSHDSEPAKVTWHSPSELEDPTPATYQETSVVTLEQKRNLLDAVLAILPAIGKDKSLALSVTRVLVILSRCRELAAVIGERRNLQKFSVMVKQLSSNLDEHLQSALMLTLRHIIEDDDTLRQIMHSEIIAHMSSRGSRQIDTTGYVRELYPFVLRSPKIFVEVTNEIVKLQRYETHSRPQNLVLKSNNADTIEGANVPEQENHVSGQTDIPNTETQPKASIEDGAGPQDPTKGADSKAPVVERPDGVIHFLLSDLLNYKDVEDSETTPIAHDTSKSAPLADPTQATIVSGSGAQEQGSDTTTSSLQKKAEKGLFKIEEHPIHVYRCFILQCLTELLHSYNRTKIEFINFSRKADPLATTPSKPRSGVLNYLLNALVTAGSVEGDESIANKKKSSISEWAMRAIVALCSKTGESGFSPAVQRYPSHPHVEDNDDEPDLAFVRRFVLEHAIKAFKDAIMSSDVPQIKYARIIGLAELFNKLLTKPSGAEGSAGMHNSSYKVLSKMMFEKNLISILTSSLAEIDLTYSGAKRVIKCILRPLHELTATASRLSLTSPTPIMSVLSNGEEEVISSASSASSSVSDLEDEREETPDFYRNSTLGMSEPNHQHQSTSESDEDEEDEDEEMFEEDFAEEMDYGEPPFNDGEVVSDEELEEQMAGASPLEGVSGEIPMNIEIVMEGDPRMEVDTEDDDDDIDDDEDDDEDDDTDEDEDDDDEDEAEDFIMGRDDEMGEEEINGDDENDSLDDGPEDEEDWQDDEEDPGDELRPQGEGESDINILDLGGALGEMPQRQDAPGLQLNNLLHVLGGAPHDHADGNGGHHHDLLLDIDLPRDQAEDNRNEDEDENDEDEDLDENEDIDYDRFNQILETHDRMDEDHFPWEEPPTWLRRHRRIRIPGHTHSFLGRHGRPGGDLHNAMGRSARHQHTIGSGPDDGTNPLLQRQYPESPLATSEGFELVINNPSGPISTGPVPFFRNEVENLMRLPMPTNFDPIANLPFGGRISATALAHHGEILDYLMQRHGTGRDMQIPVAEIRSLLEGATRLPTAGVLRDNAHVRRDVMFNPTVTAVRWQEEAKLLYGHMHVEKTQRVIHALLAKLVPPAIEEERFRRKKAEEDRKREDAERAERERVAKEAEEAEKIKREEEEAERKRREEEEREAAAASAAAAQASETIQSSGQQPTVELMEDIQSTNETGEHDAVSGIEAAVPRVFTTIRGRQLDITGMSIDAEYLEALPEELREEVIMQQYTSQQEQAQEEGREVTGIDPDFLNALPEDIRDEIRQQEAHAQRRREREAARRQATQTGGPAQPEEMDNDSFLATLDPALRRAILAEQPPEVLQQLDPRHAAEGRAHARHLFRYQDIPAGGQARGDRAGRDSQRDTKKQVVQMLDKAGVATLLRLMFLPQQGSVRQNLQIVLRNICGNRQTRFEVITLFLLILKEGSGDVSAVERSLANLSLRAKASAGVKTPQPLKRTLSMQPGGISDEITPLMIIQQCLGTLRNLSRSDSHVKSIFLREIDVSSSSKSRSSKKGKGKENRASKFPLNDLISLLDRNLIMESSTCLQMCAELLAAVTSPLPLLLKKEKEKPKPEDQDDTAPVQMSIEGSATATIPQVLAEDAVMREAEPLLPTQSQAEQNEVTTDNANPGTDLAMVAESDGKEVAKDQDDDEHKSKRIFDPPVVPDHNVQLVVSILVAQECSHITFGCTLESIGNLSFIPGASTVFREELISQAQSLSLTILADLNEFLPLIKTAASGTDLQGIAMSKFSPAGSDQVKLLRVLTALDFLYDPKRFAHQEHAEDDGTNAKSLLNSSYEKLNLSAVWKKLSECLVAMREKDNVLSFATILISLIESLMVVCKNTSLKDSALPRQVREQSATSPVVETLSELEELFFNFTTEHRKILNEIVRQNPKLMQGTGNFALLVKNPKVLEFDNKRSYFTKQIHSKQREQRHPQPPLQIAVRRSEVFLDSFKSLYFKSAEEMKYGKLSIRFHNEEGVDAGGVTRDWYSALARGIFNSDYALWQPVAADKTTFHPSSLSYVNEEHLMFFKFIGRIIGKALHEGRVLDCHFSRAVYKQLLGRQTSLKDMESLDMDYYKSLLWILENPIDDVITEDFSVVTDYFGQEQVVDLIPNGRNVPVTDENKQQYVQALVEHRLVGSVKEQLENFVKGFHDIIPPELVSIFNEQELELLISGLPEIDVDDWKANTEYHNYSASSQQIQWFWRAVKSFTQPEKASLLQFITGTSKVPLNGFRDLEGMHGVTKMNIHRDPSSKDRLPSSHTCFNQLDLPEYDNYETLKKSLLTACELGGNYFGFA